MRERPFLKALCYSLGSMVSVFALVWIVAEQPLPATDTTSHEAAHVFVTPKRRSLTASAAEPQLLPAVDQPDIRMEHRIIADRVLRALPSGCASQLQNFYVRYDNPKQRGLGGKSTIILAGTAMDGSILPATEFTALLIHECGHLAHSAMPGGPASGASAFRDGQQIFYADSPFVQFASISWESEQIMRRGTTGQSFASGYAKSDVFEDFAEFYAAYILQPDWLEERAEDNAAIAAKLAWMETYFPTPLRGVIDGQAEWKGTVPWDITKLPYSWHITDIANRG